ncbi:MAG: sensor histidine kinase [Streptosporangiaceae bacterium]
MTGQRRRLAPEVAHAARVALAAALLIGVVYAGCAAVLNRLASARLAASVDARLQERLADARLSHGGPAVARNDDDDDDPPVFLWRAVSAHRATALSAGAPALPASLARAASRPMTAQLRSGSFRLAAIRYRGGWLVAGQSLAEQDHLEAVLSDGESLAAPVLLLAIFVGSLIIGLRALSPVEQSRRRQLEFTADASHELRTPLSVIAAETSIALAAPREAADYRDALTRIEGESRRLRAIVEDLLWLARFDSRPPPPGDEPIDLPTIAAECAERFGAVAHSGSFAISVAASDTEPAWISAPPEWIDRLVGVLVDNSCRYAGPGGTVRISVAPRGSRVVLAVEDTGPGIRAEDRDRLFDRFHRSAGDGGSAGLGLAIADSIVRRTSGQWRVGDSALGGALFEVSWRRSPSRQQSLPATAAGTGQHG